MATIDQVKKHYDKLTDPERFALLHAAAVRDDDGEIKELLKTAPRKHWSMPTTYGLSEGFKFTGMWYMMQQQADLMIVFWMFHTYSNTFETFDMVFEGRKIVTSAEEIVNKLIRRVLANATAWMELCQEYKINSQAELEKYPRYDEMMLLIAVLDKAAGEMGEEAQPSHEEITKALDGMRAAIVHIVKDWE